MRKIKIDKVLGSRRFSNYWWATIILLGSSCFFFVGIFSYLDLSMNNIITTVNSHFSFLPQGAVMTFYGVTGIVTSLFLWYTIILNVGSGYNEFNNQTGLVTIFRLGFPGKNRILKLEYRVQEISAIKINIQEGLSPKREIFLKIKDNREIPLTKVGEPVALSEIERQAKEISSFLKINLEGAEY